MKFPLALAMSHRKPRQGSPASGNVSCRSESRRPLSVIPWQALVLCLLAAIAAVLLLDETAQAQGGDNDYVDVGLILEVPYYEGGSDLHLLNIIVINNGQRTAYDVEVVLEIKYPDNSVYTPERGFVPEVPVGSASLEGRFLRWSIPALEGLQRVEAKAIAEHRDSVNNLFDNALIPHEHFGRVTTSSFEGEHHKGNNTSRVWAFMIVKHSKHIYGVLGNYSVVASVDNPSPSPGSTINFTITAARTEPPSGELPDGIIFPLPSPPIDLKVDIELTNGLSVTGTPTYASDIPTGSTPPASVNYSNGIFNIGTLNVDEPG